MLVGQPFNRLTIFFTVCHRMEGNHRSSAVIPPLGFALHSPPSGHTLPGSLPPALWVFRPHPQPPRRPAAGGGVSEASDTVVPHRCDSGRAPCLNTKSPPPAAPATHFHLPDTPTVAAVETDATSLLMRFSSHVADPQRRWHGVGLPSPTGPMFQLCGMINLQPSECIGLNTLLHTYHRALPMAIKVRVPPVWDTVTDGWPPSRGIPGLASE